MEKTDTTTERWFQVDMGFLNSGTRKEDGELPKKGTGAQVMRSVYVKSAGRAQNTLRESDLAGNVYCITSWWGPARSCVLGFLNKYLPMGGLKDP